MTCGVGTVAPVTTNNCPSIGNIAWGIALGLILFFLILSSIGLIIGAFAGPNVAGWMNRSYA